MDPTDPVDPTDPTDPTDPVTELPDEGGPILTPSIPVVVDGPEPSAPVAEERETRKPRDARILGVANTVSRPAAVVLPQTGAPADLGLLAGSGLTLVVAGGLLLATRRRGQMPQA